MLTPKENYLRVMRHEKPEWIPNNLEDINFLIPILEIERWPEDESGVDGFGVEWTFVPGTSAPMPTLGKEILHDVTEWKEVVKI